MTPAEISLLLGAVAAVVSAITAFIKFGLGERGTLTISQAQGAATIMDGVVKALNAELDRKDEIIQAIKGERDMLRTRLAECEGEVNALRHEVTECRRLHHPEDRGT